MKPEDYKIKCSICGKLFNPANLYSVFLHQHKGFTPTKNYIGKKINLK